MNRIYLLKKTICFLIILLILSTTKFIKRAIDNPIESSIILYRIIGNDLPPRHSSKQTIANILFILQNEPSFKNVTKIWILNRIVNNQVEQTLIDLFNQYNQFYFRIPFDWDEYRQIPYYFPLNFPLDDYCDPTKFRKLKSWDKLLVIDTLYYQKIFYAVNINGARNFALCHGKQETRSDWLMVFDGNCFVSAQGFDEIRQALLINGSRIQYFMIPTQRLIHNNEVFRKNRINATEEPQLIFRRDSTAEFLETMQYGKREKQELLAYLGEKRYNGISSIWNPKQRKPIDLIEGKSKPLFQYAGFNFRLYSGSNSANERSGYIRGCSRYAGLIIFLQNLDSKLKQQKLLPEPSRMNLHPCKFWSDEQLIKFIEAARQTRNIKSIGTGSK